MCVRNFFGSLECVNWKEEVKEINFNKFMSCWIMKSNFNKFEVNTRVSVI